MVSLDAFCKAKGWPVPEAEVRFHPTRKWRFDWAWADQKLALEIDGGVWVRGAHGRGTGIVRDQEKGREAAALGWRIIRCQPKDLYSPGVLDAINRALQWRTEAV